MGFKFKSDSDKWATINALRVAAERYEEDRLEHAAEHPTLWRQFKDQQEAAIRIADEIEAAE